jgi:cyclopropane-fatty-acyl-phospholipid synthase
VRVDTSQFAGWARAGEAPPRQQPIPAPAKPSFWRDRFERVLADADVCLDGARPWDPRVHDERVFGRIAARGARAARETYVAGWWDCDRLDELTSRLLRAGADAQRISSAADWLRVAWDWPRNLSSVAPVLRRTDDLGDDLFRAMLDARRIYSCGYWRDAATLDQAQEAKLELVARKLALLPGMRVLDVGCGWGGAARFLAERYGVEVIGLTDSHEQARFAADSCRGLPVSIVERDVGSFDGTFDRAVSLGRFEQVGPRSYRTFLRAVRDRLARDGMFLLETAGSLVTSRLPTAVQIAAASEDRLVIEDWQNLGADYDATLLAWHRNFERAWPRLAARHDEPFHRMWRYSLLTSAGSFRARRNQLWQVVLSTRGVPGGYRPTR